jgi:LytS/YehU family sensor histidine kinase
MTKGLIFVKFPIAFWMPHAQLSQKLLQVAVEPQTKTLVFFALLPVLLAFSFLVFVFYRSRREAVFRKKETELQLQKSEVALKALKAQINPHFIFNCLNSIHHYIYHHPVDKAGSFLLKFSQQIRYVLESSELQWVPLADEIEANRNYLELEQLRLNHSFDFSISHAATLDPDAVHIPPMLIQPFLENAVWHGVAGGGSIHIDFGHEDDRHVRCKVLDTVPAHSQVEKTPYHKSVKKTSMGMNLLRERFAMLNAVLGRAGGFTLNDRKDGILGKEVTIIIPFQD